MAIPKSKYIWLNGKYTLWDKAQVHFLTHGLHYGSAFFEGIRCYNTRKGPAIFRLNDHFDRFYDSAKILEMKLPFTQKKLVSVTKELVKKNKLKECYIRPLGFFGYGRMGINPLGIKPMVGIAAWKWGAYLGAAALKKGIRAEVSSWTRIHPTSMPTKAKASGNYVNSILAKIEAVNDGYDEAILLDHQGNVSEASAENLFIVKDGILMTAPKTDILEGITRESLIQVAQDFGMPFKEERFTRDQLYTADEVFMCGTAAEVTPVRSVDKRKIGKGKPGEITKTLQKTFFDIVHGKNAYYEKWLDYI
jgi:branched-chain amino acid aminotransferase